MSTENDDCIISAKGDQPEFPPQIDLGEVVILHMDVVEEAPWPDIFIGARRRPDPGPPTTRALANALTRWREDAEVAATEAAASEKSAQQKRKADPAPPPSSDSPASSAVAQNRERPSDPLVESPALADD